ncbi:hypothetical protein BGZ88_003609, partial [Linnemannia elongata]
MLNKFLVDKNGGTTNHLHCGFEIVTYMLKGQTHHKDLPGVRVDRTEDLQWVTAGTKDCVFGDAGQVSDPRSWISSGSTCPRSTSCASPSTSNFWTHRSHAPDPRVYFVVKAIAGELHSLKSQIYIRTPMMDLDVKMFRNQTITHTVLKTYNRFMDVLNGTAYIGDLGNETQARVHHTLLPPTMVLTTSESRQNFEQIAGEPVKEPVVQI